MRLNKGFTVIVAAAVTMFGLGFGSAATGPAAASGVPAQGAVKLIFGPQYRFDNPGAGPMRYVDGGNTTMFWCCGGAMAASGNDLFVMNGDGNSLTEINASTGALIRVISGAQYGFDNPDGLALSGNELFVANSYKWTAGSITEINASTGALIRIFGQKDLRGPSTMVVDGNDLWVANPAFLTEFNASTAAYMRSVSGADYQFEFTGPMVLSGNDLFVASRYSTKTTSTDSVTELNASTGALVRVIGPFDAPPPNSAETYNSPSAMVAYGTDIFLAHRCTLDNCQLEGGLSEINALTGAIVEGGIGSVNGSTSASFGVPSALALEGPDLWVANDAYSSLLEFNVPTGQLLATIPATQRQIDSYELNAPNAMVVADGHMFVANSSCAPASCQQNEASEGYLTEFPVG
jgi:hypothetical protein